MKYIIMRVISLKPYQPEPDSDMLDRIYGRIPPSDIRLICKDCMYLDPITRKCLLIPPSEPSFCSGPFHGRPLWLTSPSKQKSWSIGDNCPYCGGKTKNITKSVISDSRARAMIDPCWHRCLKCNKEWKSDEFQK